MRFAYLSTLALASVCFGFGSCSTPGVTFQAPSSFALNVSAIASGLVGAGAPIEPGSNPQTLASVCCGTSGCAPTCPGPVSANGYTIDFACTSNVCDPAPVDVASPGTPIDVASLTSSYLAAIAKVELRSITYTISKNTLTTDIEPIDVYWGSSGATAWNSAGVSHLGTVPTIAAGQTGMGTVALDSAGLAALNGYLTSTAKQVKIFYRTRFDLAPGEPIPGGEIDVDALLEIKATGTLR